MTDQTRLKSLLKERHWQSHRTFCAEFDKAAVQLDPRLKGTYPSRPQFYRWIAGDLRDKPYPDACRVLEQMFPGWRAADLFRSPDEPVTPAEAPTPVGMLPPGGEVTERRLSVKLDIAPDGAVDLVYEHEVENTSQAPFTRFTRELWFAVTDGPVQVEPYGDDEHPFVIQRVHETPSHLMYACQMLPALAPGEKATVRYRCTGGAFRAEHYWRQAIVCPVDLYEIEVRLRGVKNLSQLSATEERADGSEVSAAESVSLDREDGDIILSMSRRDLRPNQFVALRWDFVRAAAP